MWYIVVAPLVTFWQSVGWVRSAWMTVVVGYWNCRRDWEVVELTTRRIGVVEVEISSGRKAEAWRPEAQVITIMVGCFGVEVDVGGCVGLV